MEHVSSSVAVTLSLSNSLCDSSGISSSTEITRLKLVTDAVSLLTNPSKLVIPNDSSSEVATKNLKSSGREGASKEKVENRNAMIQQSEKVEVLSFGDETNLVVVEELISLDVGSTIGLSNLEMVKPVEADPILAQAIILGVSGEVPRGELITSLSSKVEGLSSSCLNPADADCQLLKEKMLGKGGIRSVFELDCIPLWGSVSICGKRREMEDAVAAVPRFMKIPIKMLMCDHAIDGFDPSLTHVTSHFYGVYDGHGGSQVFLFIVLVLIFFVWLSVINLRLTLNLFLDLSLLIFSMFTIRSTKDL